jgi:outer membrane protein assembly factor BamB
VGWSQFRKTGLTFHSPAQSFKGYTLVTPIAADFSVLLDMDGRVVHRWSLSGFRVFHARLLPRGTLLALCSDASLPPPPQTPFDQPPPPFDQHIRRLGGSATHLREVDWDGKLVWQYLNPVIHHDFVREPNGNTLVAEWVEVPEDLARRVRGGAKRPGEKFPRMLSDDIVEIDPGGNEIGRIHLWQLLDPVRDAICPLETRWEWTHLNSLAVMPSGEILVSCRTNSRVIIVDPTTDTITWKYGSPDVYHQHHASALENGNVQIFDNGMHRVGMPYSRVVEVEPSANKVIWEYSGEPAEQFFSAHISGAERLPNQNVLIAEGASGRLFEVTHRGETVWEWVSPFAITANGRTRAWIFRTHRYAPGFSGLQGKSLDPATHADFNRLYALG